MSSPVKSLLPRSPVNSTDTLGNTPLVYATWSGDEGSVARLIKAKADVKVVNKAGKTPMHYATEREFVSQKKKILFFIFMIIFFFFFGSNFFFSSLE